MFATGMSMLLRHGRATIMWQSQPPAALIVVGADDAVKTMAASVASAKPTVAVQHADTNCLTDTADWGSDGTFVGGVYVSS